MYFFYKDNKDNLLWLIPTKLLNLLVTINLEEDGIDLKILDRLKFYLEQHNFLKR